MLEERQMEKVRWAAFNLVDCAIVVKLIAARSTESPNFHPGGDRKGNITVLRK